MNQKCLKQAFKCGSLWLMFLESSLPGCYTLGAILLNPSHRTQQSLFFKPFHLHWHICNYFCRRLTHWQWQFIGLSFPWWAKHQTMLLIVSFLENRFLIGTDWNRSPRYLLLWPFVLDYLFQSWGGISPPPHTAFAYTRPAHLVITKPNTAHQPCTVGGFQVLNNSHFGNQMVCQTPRRPPCLYIHHFGNPPQ